MPATLRTPLVLDSSPDAALGAGVTSNINYTATRPFDIYDAHVLATATNAGSTAQGSRGVAGVFNTFTTAMAMATDGTITRATTGMVTAQRVVAVADVIRAIFVDGGGGGGANGHLYIALLPNAITGAA